jgi:hypothetical protein
LQDLLEMVDVVMTGGLVCTAVGSLDLARCNVVPLEGNVKEFPVFINGRH